MVEGEVDREKWKMPEEEEEEQEEFWGYEDLESECDTTSSFLSFFDGQECSNQLLTSTSTTSCLLDL